MNELFLCCLPESHLVFVHCTQHDLGKHNNKTTHKTSRLGIALLLRLLFLKPSLLFSVLFCYSVSNSLAKDYRSFHCFCWMLSVVLKERFHCMTLFSFAVPKCEHSCTLLQWSPLQRLLSPAGQFMHIGCHQLVSSCISAVNTGQFMHISCQHWSVHAYQLSLAGHFSHSCQHWSLHVYQLSLAGHFSHTAVSIGHFMRVSCH